MLAEIETVHGWSSSGRRPSAECRRREDLAYELADEIGCRYLQAIGSYEGSVAEAARGLRSAVRPGRRARAARRRRVAAVHEHRDGGGRAGDRRGAGRPNGGYCADIWHHRRGANDDSMLRALPGDRVYAVQMDDGPMRPQLDDYKQDCLANRVPPGEGEFDCVQFVGLLREIGVRAPISLEVCSTELWAAPAAEAATLAADAMRAVLAAAGT